MPFTKTADQVFRDYVTDGVPASGVHKPDKAEVRQWGNEVEEAVGAVELDARYNLNALQIANNLGLGTNLQLCLDAGAIASSPGSGTKWLDLSGNGYDFNYGDGATETTYPTFNGNAGGKSLREYLGLDGGDYLTYDAANETWMDALHKDNAIFSGIFWLHRPSGATADAVFGTRGANSGGNIGALLTISTGANNKLALSQRNGSSLQTVGASSFDVGTGAWVMLSVSINEATGSNGLILGQNLTFESFTSTYTSPSASAATVAMSIGSDGAAGSLWPNGSRFGMGLMWSGTALTQAQIAAFFHATRDRYGV